MTQLIESQLELSQLLSQHCDLSSDFRESKFSCLTKLSAKTGRKVTKLFC